ncbi:hypothetical protein [Salegentibacter mishustinae]|uniref:Uncharacterized protein n=1 Tax=Salegentibacter mishustinae TaxID=270918 RepID=A0A0Q9Z6N9_9FLAO|nr:hypothetical protein [Salegentibacter mishustinae]KRG28630.1 hypothetical protein APR42_07605 [Salegentibacter mishustinae]PNW22560.1 hypothetical protein APB85_15365 [Salegentibacter mishustinae]PZX67807.1 hypothetical protein LY54_00545 [Salegentibacter mishustinae]GGW77230.1 hypothetical protein GCM10008086_00710 [Salegentibacter mishustinae]
MLRSLKLILAMVLFINLGCSTDSPDSTPSNPTENPSSSENPSNPPLTGTSVKTSEIINIEVNINLNSDEYQGTFGSRDVNLVKVDENHLMVMVPSDMEEGISTLKVSGLDIEKHYDISQLRLNSSESVTFEELLTVATGEISGFDVSPESQYVSGYWSELKKAFDDASSEEQFQAAAFYQANKEMIDGLLRDDYTRQSESEMALLRKHGIAVAALGIGVGMAVAGFPNPIIMGIGAAVAITAWFKAKDYLDHLANLAIKKVNVVINDLDSDLSRQAVSRLEFTHEVGETLNFAIKQRSLNSQDQDSGNENIQTFFKDLNLFNSFVTRLNKAIRYINENVFLSDKDEVDEGELGESPIETVTAGMEIYEKMEFSVGSDKVEIAEISFDGGLKLKLKIKDVDNLSQDYIDTELNYSYSDDFNDLSGFFEIRVNKETANYKLQIGKYEGYSNPVVIHTLENGDDLTLPNYMTHLVRLTLDDVPVLVGNGSETGWTGSDVIGYYPESNEDINIENYGITVYDATNNKEVTISVNLTLKNYGYNRFVNNSITIDYGSHGEAEGKPKNIFFYPDGTYKYVSNDGSSSHDGTYNFVGIHSSASNIQCQEYQTTDFINSVIQLSGGSDSYYRYRYPKYIMLYEDGTLHTRQSANCQNRPFTWHLY